MTLLGGSESPLQFEPSVTLHGREGTVRLYCCMACGALVPHDTSDDDHTALSLHRKWHEQGADA